MSFTACPETVRDLIARTRADLERSIIGSIQYNLLDNTLGDTSYNCATWAEEVLWDVGFDLHFPSDQPLITDPGVLWRRCSPMP